MRPGKDCLLSILIELCVVLLVAASTPLLIRYCLLPSSVHHQYPLNVIFHTCDHDLHSVCSFPSATLDYEKNSLFSPNVAYYLNIQLKFADVANSKMLGLFQNVITTSDENGKILKQYTRSAYVKEPGVMTKATHIFFFPLYFLGFFYDYSTLTIPMSADYRESFETPSTKLVFTIQDKFANIEDAELIVTARFGFIRHLLYYWPSVSYAVIFAAVFASGCFLITAKLGYLEYSKRSKAAAAKDREEILKNESIAGKDEDAPKEITLTTDAPAEAPSNASPAKKAQAAVAPTAKSSSVDVPAKDAPTEEVRKDAVAPEQETVRQRKLKHTYYVVCGNVSAAMSIKSGHATQCLGFCGRNVLVNDSGGDVATTAASSVAGYSQCGPCAFGYRNNAASICEPCDSPLQAYDWMYLLFVALLPLLLHMQFIRAGRKYNRARYLEVSEYLCVILENVIACVVSVLIYPPQFSFFLNGCTKHSIKEWYPACYNPRIGFTKTMRCTYEVVFPLYSITFTHHLVLITSILVLRTTLYCVLLYKIYNGKPFYHAVISVPLLAVMHSVLSGVLFYSFPWILLVGSLWAMVYHLAVEGKKPLREMCVDLVTSPTHLVFLSITMLLLSFSVVAIVTPLEFALRWTLLLLVPVPLAFYLLTIPFSNPTTTMRLS